MDGTRARFVVGIAIIIGAVGYLVASATDSTGVYFYTVGEFHDVLGADDGPDPTRMAIRVMGHVRPGSIEREPSAAITRFMITDPDDPARSLPVVYRKVAVPDTFKDNSEAVVEGHYTADGVFEAETLMAKCPSKYEGREGEHPEGIPMGTST